ncbi:hypothetical protein JL720_16435 [Aureococcus anophagefferens]|nr:hypothetical protein JL720_16435 [Aureococcus anophagefferens]
MARFAQSSEPGIGCIYVSALRALNRTGRAHAAACDLVTGRAAEGARLDQRGAFSAPMAWQQALAPVAFWVVFTIGRRFVGQWLLNARRAAPAEEEEAPATASAPKDAKNAKEATVTAPKNAKKKKKPPEAPEAPKSAGATTSAGASRLRRRAGAKPRPSAEDGVGRYALAPPGEVYWTEAHDTVHGESQEQVLNAFGYHWDKRPPGIAGAKVLLEKSPPNVVLARYLQALVDYVPGAANRRRNAGLDDDLRVPDAEAPPSRYASLLRGDERPSSRRQTRGAEDFAAAPAATLLDLWAFLGLDATRADAAAAAAAVDGDPNAKHRDAYCAAARSDPRKARDHARLAERYGALVREHHDYDLAGWCA